MYGDPVLNSLESQVEINNQNVAQYAQKYLQAVALVAQSDAALYPSITAGASGSRCHQEHHQFPGKFLLGTGFLGKTPQGPDRR